MWTKKHICVCKEGVNIQNIFFVVVVQVDMRNSSKVKDVFLTCNNFCPLFSDIYDFLTNQTTPLMSPAAVKTYPRCV